MEGLEVELAAGEGHEVVETILAGAFAGFGMNDLSFVDKDITAQGFGGNLEHRGSSRQAFHLQNVRQTDAPQDTPETVLRLNAREFVECCEDVLPAFANLAFVEHQFRAP